MAQIVGTLTAVRFDEAGAHATLATDDGSEQQALFTTPDAMELMRLLCVRAYSPRLTLDVDDGTTQVTAIGVAL